MKSKLIMVFTIAMLTASMLAAPAGAAAKKNAEQTVEKTTVEPEKTTEEKAKEKSTDKELKVGKKTVIVKEKKETCYVKDEDGLNIRKLPDPKTQMLGVLADGDEVHVTGYVYEYNKKNKLKKNGWVRIRFTVKVNGVDKKRVGYILNELTSVKPGEEEVNEEPYYEEEYDDYYDDYYDEYYDDYYDDGSYSYYQEPVYTAPAPAPAPAPEPEYLYCGFCGEYTGGQPHDHSLGFEEIPYYDPSQI